MSLLNGLATLGTGLNTFAGDAATDLVAPKRSPLMDRAAAPPEPTPTPAAALPGPRMPAGVNPYGDSKHAQALWLAERSIMGPESGGKADAQNPVSSAGGAFQIINSTWDTAIKKMGLPVAASDAERNAQKYNLDLNTRIMRVINSDAAALLDKAGLPVTVQTLQASHRLGPAGAITAIKTAMENPNAPLVGSGLSANAVKGNGDMAHLSVGEFLANPYPRSGA